MMSPTSSPCNIVFGFNSCRPAIKRFPSPTIIIFVNHQEVFEINNHWASRKDESILTFFLQHKPDPSMQYKIIIEGPANIGKPEKPSVGHRAEYSLFHWFYPAWLLCEKISWVRIFCQPSSKFQSLNHDNRFLDWSIKKKRVYDKIICTFY